VFTLKIRTDNAAFEESPELSRLLRQLAKRFEDAGGPNKGESSTIFDLSGNRVGEWKQT
jgi:hypothetical protein